MQIDVLKSKLHKAMVTDARLDYVGSITIDENFMDAVGLMPYEKVLVSNINNGSRWETYTIPGERGSRVICMNGAAARLAQKGDFVIVMSFARIPLQAARGWKPQVLTLEDENRVTHQL
ncbi:MAG TPA: aspartate 1-decarboxylase [Candidatus Brocadiia bacterium]|nr:aspartate 1-decarboxylase [Candidatus Brocadiia bacterium]